MILDNVLCGFINLVCSNLKSVSRIIFIRLLKLHSKKLLCSSRREVKWRHGGIC
jgi:hypothetical protein